MDGCFRVERAVLSSSVRSVHSGISMELDQWRYSASAHFCFASKDIALSERCLKHTEIFRTCIYVYIYKSFTVQLPV